MTFEEFLNELTLQIKSEPEIMFKTSNEAFAKSLDEAFRSSMNDVQNSLLQSAKGQNLTDEDVENFDPNDLVRRKALDAKIGIEQKKALDAYSNNALLLGQADVFSSFDSYDFNAMLYAWPLWTSLYTSSWVFAKVIDVTGSDMIRNGWKISLTPERLYSFHNINNKLYRKDITPEYDMSKVYKKQNKALSFIIKATKWMLLYGGSVVCLLDDNIESIEEYETPLTKLNKGSKLNYIVADRWQGVVASTELVDDDESPDFGTPKYYSVRQGSNFFRFHHTRVARFVNGDLPTFLKQMLLGWGLPMGTRLFSEINRDERIKNMITSLLSKYNLEIVQTDGMKQYMHGELTPEHEQQLDHKLAMINRYRHFNSMVFLDKNDVYQRIDGNVGGLYQLFDANTRAVTGAASMPVVKLYGDQSQGLSGSSFDDLRLWEDHLNSERGAKLRQPVEKISEWLLMSEGIPTDNFGIQFNSSLPKTMNERIDETRAVLDMYNQLMSMGLYDLEMVRNELKERDDLLLGNQLQLKSKEELEEIQEEVEDEQSMDEFGMEPSSGDYGGGQDFDFEGNGDFEEPSEGESDVDMGNEDLSPEVTGE